MNEKVRVSKREKVIVSKREKVRVCNSARENASTVRKTLREF